MRALTGTTLLLTACLGCIPEVVLDGKACPCVDGFACDTVLNRCVKASNVSVGDADAEIKPGELFAEWSTAHSIRWRWTLGSDDTVDRLAGYTLVVGSSESDVLGQVGVQHWAGSVAEGASDALRVNPELGRYHLMRTGDLEPVNATITDQLDINSPYFARLIATDTTGNRWATNVAQGRTTFGPQNEGTVLFSEGEAFFDIQLPSDFVRATGEASLGEHHYEWRNASNKNFENLRLQGPGVSGIDAEMDDADFVTIAYFEVSVRVAAEEPSDWSEVWLRFNDGQVYARFSPLTFRNDDAYRTIEIPLRAMSDDQNGDRPLRAADLALTLDEVSVGGTWSDGAVVRLDEYHLRW